MKPLKKALLVLMLGVIALPGAASAQTYTPKAQDLGGYSDSGSGGCINALNNCQTGCSVLNGFTKAGCYTDCTLQYYWCIYYSATN